MADLQMCGRHMLPFMALCLSRLDWTLVETEHDVLGIDQRDDTIEVYRAAKSIIYPEQGREVARVGETGGFQKDVVESTATGHEGFDCIDAGVLDGAADAAVG